MSGRLTPSGHDDEIRPVLGDGRRHPSRAARRGDLGWELHSVDPDRGEIEVWFSAGKHLLNPVGVVQGGFVSAMLDDAMGPALVATLPDGQFAPTLELKVNFLRPVYPGRLRARGRVVHRGGTIAFLAGELFDADGELVATATATARVVTLPR